MRTRMGTRELEPASRPLPPPRPTPLVIYRFYTHEKVDGGCLGLRASFTMKTPAEVSPSLYGPRGQPSAAAELHDPGPRVAGRV